MVNQNEMKAADTSNGTLVMITWQCDVVVHPAQCRVGLASLDRQIAYKFVEVAYTCLVGYMFCYDFLNQH